MDEDTVRAIRLAIVRNLARTDRDRAEIVISRLLNMGFNDPEFLSIASRFVGQKEIKRKPGRPPKKFSQIDTEIQLDYYYLRSNGFSYEESTDALADEHPIGKRSIETIINRPDAELLYTIIDGLKRKAKDEAWSANGIAQRLSRQDAIYGADQDRIFFSPKNKEYAELIKICPHHCENGCRINYFLQNRRHCAVRYFRKKLKD